MTAIQAWAPARAQLGEGPFWQADRRQLWWVDIKRGEVWSAQAQDAARCVHRLPPPVSAVIPAGDRRLVLAAGRCLHVFDEATGATSLLAQLPGEPPGNRCNEVRTDPWGNLWIGTMDDAGKRPTGGLWRLSRLGELEKVLDGVTIANTLAWDTARQRLYFADSARGAIHAFDCDADTAALRNQRVLLGAGQAPGVPDGSALDDEGCLWNARWEGQCLVRISPEGRVVEAVSLPVRRPTSCAFGDGPALFVTSALPDPGTDPAPLDGAVLRVAVARGGPAGRPYAGPMDATAVRLGNLHPGEHWLLP